jgi:3-deoxy-D-manno-octulosonic-acid transferase
VNARLSEKSARGYRRFGSMTRTALQQLAGIAAQDKDDAARLLALGAPQVEVFGNLKFDLLPPSGQLADAEALRRLMGDRPVLLAASTREGEESLILDALQRHALKDALVVIVPRHPQRFDEVATLIGKYGLRLQRRSENCDIDAATQVLLGDSMGEMFAYYAACDIAFIGGSLLNFGGQNLIEACAVGTPVLLGPHTFNFAQAAEQAVTCGAALRVADAAELLQVAAMLLADTARRTRMGEAGKAFAARHRGATERTMAMLERYLPSENHPRL